MGAVLPVIAAVLLNCLLNLVCETLALPIFLDTVFTILVAAVFGLVPSLATALLTNLLMEAVNGFPGYLYPFAVVNMLSALVVAVRVRRKHFETPADAFWTIIILVLVNAAAGSLIATFVFGGITGENVDNIVRGFIMAGRSLLTAAFMGRLLINLVDKGLSVIIVYPVYKWLQHRKSLKRNPVISGFDGPV